MFATFRWVELCEPGALEARLPVFTARGNLLLVDAVFQLPNFGAIATGEAQNDDFKNRVIGFHVNLVMELGDQRAERLKKSYANGFKVGRGLVGEALIMLVGCAGDTLKIAIEADGLRIRGNLPFGSAENDPDVTGVQLQDARRDGVGFYGQVDGCKEDDVVFSYLNDDAAAGEISDDFVFTLLSLTRGLTRKKRDDNQEEQE